MPIGKCGFQKGHLSFLTEESKKKISIAHTGKKLSEETKRKVGMASLGRNLGRKHTEEFKKKISIAKLGKKLSPEHCRKIGLAHSGVKSNWYGKKYSIEDRKKQSERLKKACVEGRHPYVWRGGITKINSKIRNSLDMRLWREAVFKRDNWTCQICTIRSKKNVKVFLHADHIKPFSLFPELRFNTDNGRTLGKECHKKTDTYMGRIKNYKKSILIPTTL